MNTVAYCCPFVPAEWIAAHGLAPARIVPEGEGGKVGKWEGGKAIRVQGSGFRVQDPRQGAAGFSPRGGDSLENRAQPTPSEIRNPRSEIGVYAGICPFARGFAGSAMAFGDAAGVVVTSACDQMRRIGDWLAERSTRPVFLMNVPSTCTPSARGLYASEVRRLGGFLVTIGGKTPSNEELARVMLEYGANREPTSEEVGRPAKEVPLALVGGPLLAEDFELFELIEQAGGRVVLDGTEQGERTRPAQFDRERLAVDPFDELVHAYFDTIPDAFRRPDGLLHEWLGREIAARNVRGVILHRYVWCDNWHAEVYRLKETLSVPVLDLDNAGADGGGRARAEARIRAFVEMLT
jgi:benzoyl-CoA reductase/2-hydroxyglutaryl-CoA dehydratase subunit BcrC/BadD/HgdB